MQHIIEVSGLSKSYGDIPAVRGIDFHVETGQLFAFLGPNGAGKSTTTEMLCTLLKPDMGEILIDGCRIGKQDEKIRSKIGVVFQNNMLDDLLSIEENLRIRGSFYGLSGSKLNEAIQFASDSTEITDILKRRYLNLSGGQKRRADIARALMHFPKILFLDEPTTGLDPQTRQNIWETIRTMQRENNMTVFLTTHYMEEAAKADYVVMIDNGQIAAQGTPVALREQYAKDMLYLRHKPESKQEICDFFKDNHISYQYDGERLKISLKSTMNALPILNALNKYILSFEVAAGTMDDAFIAITGKELRE